MTEHPPHEPNLPTSDADAGIGLADLADLPEDLLELVSAYVDGEATVDECRRVEADPTLMLHVKHLTGLTASLRTFHATEVAPADAEERRSSHVAAALAAWDDSRGGTGDGTGDAADGAVAPGAGPAPDADRSTATVVPIGAASPARDRRRRVGGAARTLAGIAAALVLVVGAAGVVAQLGSQSSDETASSATAGDVAGGASQEAFSGAVAAEAARAIPALGGFASPELVLDAAAAVPPTADAIMKSGVSAGDQRAGQDSATTIAATTTAAAAGAATTTVPLLGQSPAAPARGPAASSTCGGTTVATAQVDGLGEVAVIETADARQVVELAGCRVLAERPLPR